MIRESLTLVMGVVLVLALVAAAQPPEHREGGLPPVKVVPPPLDPGPGPAMMMREYAEQLRMRAREAQELADRLRRQADELDQMAKRQMERGGGPPPMDGLKRELAEIKEGIGRAEREGHWQKVAELRQRASQLMKRWQPPAPTPRLQERQEIKRQIERLREEARQAKDQGRFEQSERIWQEADRLEQKLRESAFDAPGPREAERQEIRRKMQRLRDEARQAKDQGRFEEAEHLGKEADRLERTLREKDELLARQLREQKKPDVKQPGPPYKDEIMGAMQELKREIGRLWQALNEMRNRPGQ